MGPGDLAEALKALPAQRDSRLQVGTSDCDDAGVYRLRSDLSIVNTVDFFPPIVDDPYTYGRIAAANAISDVYAMGGRPVTAMNIVGFPSKMLPGEVLGEILRGGAERVAAAGAVIVGGHTVADDELKYGLAVTGTIHPKRIIKNGGARAGDILVLTKALGTGIVATGIKRGSAEPGEVRAAVESMVALNDVAGTNLYRLGARAATDITGFGLAGHAAEMAAASASVRLVFDSDALVLLPGTARLAEAGLLTGGGARNRQFLGTRLKIARDVGPAVVEAIVDPQSSGGLLVSLPARRAPGYVSFLHDKGLRPAVVGRVEKRPARSRALVAFE